RHYLWFGLFGHGCRCFYGAGSLWLSSRRPDRARPLVWCGIGLCSVGAVGCVRSARGTTAAASGATRIRLIRVEQYLWGHFNLPPVFLASALLPLHPLCPMALAIF